MLENKLGTRVFEEVVFALEWYDSVREFMKIGFQDFTFVITKKSASESDIENVLSVMKDIAVREYGDEKYAFRSKLWHGKDASSVLMFVTPNVYDDAKREEGTAKSFKCLVDRMTKHSSVQGK